MRVLFVGDVLGKAGRRILESSLPELVQRRGCDYVIVNGENTASGRGITPPIADSIFRLGVDAITTGDHVWDCKDIPPYIQREDRLLRAYNFPNGVPGVGFTVLRKGNHAPLAVAHLCGRVFMTPIDSPFQAADCIVDEMAAANVRCCLVDFHAEATSEKQALGRYLDGRVSAVVGTHTHVPTADEMILPGGTAYLTDVGMTGPYASIIGMKIENALPRFLYATHTKLEPAKEDVRLCAVIVEIDDETGKAFSIERIRIVEPPNESDSAAGVDDVTIREFRI